MINLENKKVTYASLEMIKFLDRRDRKPGYIDFLATRLEEFDPGAERSHKMANNYRNFKLPAP